MIQYNISDKFENSDISFPFAITDRNQKPVEDFWNEIKKTIQHINNDVCKVRFIWIEADSYCQTEVFLKQILQKHHGDYPILYLHWIDYADQGYSVSSQIDKVCINDQYFTNQSKLKICVIDHVETITSVEEFANLCTHFYNNNCIFILLSKRGSEGSIRFWTDLIRDVQTHASNSVGFIRSEENFYQVKPYSIETCKEIISQAIQNESIKAKCFDLIDNSFNYELRRPYYFDLLIKSLRKMKSADEVPSSFNDTSLLEKVYYSAIEGVVSHIRGLPNLANYIQSYYSSDFVKKSGLDDQRRGPIDSYAWAFGVISYCPPENKAGYYNDAIAQIFKKFGGEYGIAKLDHSVGVCSRIIGLITEKSPTVGKHFCLDDFFISLAHYSLYGALVTAKSVYTCIDSLSEACLHSIFREIGVIYFEDVHRKDLIQTHVLLGMEIGKLLPKLSSKVVQYGLDSFFETVTDEFVVPKTNAHGLSVIPLTNFEFEKFVKDHGYRTYYDREFPYPLAEIAVTYYKDILNFITETLRGSDEESKYCLSQLLKGYDWQNYRKIAYLYSQKDSVTSEMIYNAIQDNIYPSQLRFPAKWLDETNSNVDLPFCNPLQPVVCINLFEARAYCKWLSDKTGKIVRVPYFDPDYISVVGTVESESGKHLRSDFEHYVANKEEFFNSAEYTKNFYGSDDIDVREIAPVAIPDTLFMGLYDFVGNIFETQESKFEYFYNYPGQKARITKRALMVFEKREAAVVDYNCPGGGFQRTKANWPPDYMGQVPAFLRNQDIGFRIVFGDAREGNIKFKKDTNISIEQGNRKTEVYTPLTEEMGDSSILSNVSLYHAVENVLLSVNMDNVFQCNGRFISMSIIDKYNAMYLMLRSSGDYVHAYLLKQISTESVVRTGKFSQFVKVISIETIIPHNISLRRKCTNKAKADKVEMVIYALEDRVDYFVAFPLDIANGHFYIDFVNREENEILNCDTSYIGDYKISISEGSMFREYFYEKMKSALGVDHFLPDWVDIVDFINYIISTINGELNFDADTVFAAITTIDTSDLHEQINRLKLIQIEEELKAGV